LKWGTPVPLPEYSDKVFYVWFDAPIGYISITANYTDHWEKWWKDPENVKLVQFMGKDNIPFHTVIFPSTLLGTTDNWTLIHNISTTEYLNYEAGKFSKSKGVGVFGDNAKETGIPAEVFRYYLLSQRPETSDTTFKWQDFALKNNAQLVPNVGNLVTRFLKFLEKIGGAVTTPGELAEADKEFLNGLYTLTLKYADKLERIKIKSALQVAMDVSSLANKYIQDQELWALQKTNPGRASTVIFVTSNALRLVGLLLEPFMPSFSAKLYEQMGLTRTARDETLLEVILSAGSSEVLLSLVQAGQKIGSVAPIFRQSN
jgi:methionyl-tRNA synthetase